MNCVCPPHGWIVAGHGEGEPFQHIETFTSEVHSCGEVSWSRGHAGDYHASASNRISDRTQRTCIQLHQRVVAGGSKVVRDALVIAGMQTIIERVHARGLKIHGVTIIPRHNRAPTEGNTGWTPAKTRARNEVNEWIRTAAPFDGVTDFDQVVRDPADPDLLFAAFNCDDVHPTTRGYYARLL